MHHLLGTKSAQRCGLDRYRTHAGTPVRQNCCALMRGSVIKTRNSHVVCSFDWHLFVLVCHRLVFYLSLITPCRDKQAEFAFDLIWTWNVCLPKPCFMFAAEHLGFYFPKQRGNTEGFLRTHFRLGNWSRCSTKCAALFLVNYSKKWLLRNIHVRFDCACAHKMRAPKIGCGIFLANYRTKWLFWHVHVRFNCAGSHKTGVPGLGVRHFSCKCPYKMFNMVFLTCPCGFQLRRLAQRVCSLGTSCVCSHMCAPMCSHMCIPMWPPMCPLLCALICVLSYGCSHMCALLCVLLYALLYALLCVLSYVCSSVLRYVGSHICALICVLLCALIFVFLCDHLCMLSFVLSYVCSHMCVLMILCPFPTSTHHNVWGLLPG